MTDVPVEQLRATLLAYDPHSTLGGGHWRRVADTEWTFDRRGDAEVHGDLVYQFAPYAAFLALGMWIPCDSTVVVRLVVSDAEAQPRLEARVVHHHQTLFLIPLVWSDDDLEKCLIDAVLTRARGGSGCR